MTRATDRAFIATPYSGNGYIIHPTSMAAARKQMKTKTPYRNCSRAPLFVIMAKTTDTRRANVVSAPKWEVTACGLWLYRMRRKR